ncbi:hypothetical protein ACF8OH_03835 [Delftia sp. WSY_9]|uniref:hypothetical protein n=1 Tax=unclassified Delftia TaxID=2613839 RepID=UPI003709DE6C
MSSKRFKAQILIEQEIGCSDPAQLAVDKVLFKKKIESLQVSDALIVRLEEATASDAADTFFKALLSIVEALDSIARGGHSWAIVKLYYSAFYLLRCRMAGFNHVFFKCAGNIYSVELVKNSTPVLRSKGKFRGSDIRGDHKTIIATYVNNFAPNDILLSNTIEQISVFEWMMSAREEINYRSPDFVEPLLGHFDKALFSSEGLAYWVNKYLRDPTLVHCFLRDHCCLATPLVLARDVLSGYIGRFNRRPIESDQAEFLGSRLNSIFSGSNDFHDLVLASADS